MAHSASRPPDESRTRPGAASRPPDSSQRVDLTAFRRTGSERTTSLTGWITGRPSGTSATGPLPAPVPRVVTILTIAVLALIALGVGTAFLATTWLNGLGN